MSSDDTKLKMHQHRDFIDKVENRIYHDDWERAFPEPEWIGEMAIIARKYMRLYEESLKEESLKELEMLEGAYEDERE